MVTARTLTADDFDAVYAAFADAFSDYVVKFSPNREQLTEMLTRRGYVPEASVGLFDDERLVAFTLNGVEGERAYDSGTGVVLSHRQQGLGRVVMEASFDALRRQGCTSYVLEVLDNNHKAIELYRGLGFEEIRALQCWTYQWTENDAGRIARAPLPSWQNSDASLARAQDQRVTLGEGSVVFLSNGDLVLRGTLTAGLLREAAAIALKPLRIMNVDERDGEVAAFLEGAGAMRTVRQLELVRKL
ncbi:MAG TPA: GNAT family N-acetyltransferase [Thermoanaerobaculia bacterium]